MSLKRYTKPIDGTIPVQALLYEDEDLLASQDGVGIYDGSEKSAPHQSGTTHATTHRLFYIDATHPATRSFEMDLAHVSKTEYYAGLFTSSPKVTLYLHAIEAPPSPADAFAASVSLAMPEDPVFRSWMCDVCNYRNPPGLSPAASRICGLCGVPRSATSSTDEDSVTQPLSTSLPSSSLNFSRLTLSSASSSPAPRSPSPLLGPDGEVACTMCTFLNHPALPTCEMCGTPLPRRPAAPASRAHAKSAPASRPTSPANEREGPEARMIRLSFRRGGDKTFYAVLRRCLLGKGWEVKTARAGAAVTSNSGTTAPSGQSTQLSGINGILRTVETTAASSQTNMEDALKDLEALMVKWKDMVKLAQDLNERLTAASTTSAPGAPADVMTTQAVEPEEATFIRSSLAQLGLQMANAPVTHDMVRDERRWVDELARELAGVLQGPGGGRGREKEGIMGQRGVVGLDEVWGGWNRARGVALIPPSTFLQALPQLPQYTHPPIHTRTFAASGLSVLHTPPFTRAAFASRLIGVLTLAGPQTVVQVAHEESLPIGLTQEMVNEVEEDGEICRDEGGAGLNIAAGLAGGGWASEGSGEVRLWVNVFRGYVWDGQES